MVLFLTFIILDIRHIPTLIKISLNQTDTGLLFNIILLGLSGYFKHFQIFLVGNAECDA